MMNKTESLLKIALSSADLASKHINYQWQNHKHSIKHDGSIVTDTDISTEQIIREKLSMETPNIQIFGEELGGVLGNSSPYWLIDPIDGTRWYHLGMPIFGTLIAYIVDNHPIVGVISMPASNELLYASQGNGCFYSRNNAKPKRVAVSHISTIESSTISASGIHNSDICKKNNSVSYQLSNVINSCKAFYFTGDCIQHLLVAKGKLDAAIDTIMKPWDSAAIITCIQEAGGYVCGINGGTDNLLNCGSLISCSTKNLADQLVEILKPNELCKN